ncbi:uncharacterized protein swt1 isoform X2 [Rhinoraja longicauda]
MSRKHSKRKREKQKSPPRKSESQRHSPNHVGGKRETDQPIQHRGESSLSVQSSSSQYPKKTKLSHAELETTTTLKQSKEEWAKSYRPRSPDSKEKHELNLQKCKHHVVQSAASIGTTSLSDQEKRRSKSKQKKRKKHKQEENSKEKQSGSPSMKHAADAHIPGEQTSECKKCQSSKFCKHLFKCETKRLTEEVDLEALKAKISRPICGSLQTDFQNIVSHSYLLQEAKEAKKKDASKQSTLEPAQTLGKLTSSYDKFRQLHKEFEIKEQTKKSPKLQGSPDYFNLMQNSADSGNVLTNFEELDSSNDKSLHMNLHKKPKISKEEFDVWKVTQSPLKAVKNTANFSDGSKCLESGFWEKCNKISNCLRGLRKKSKNLEQIRNKTSIARTSSHLTNFSEKPGDYVKALEVEKPSTSFEAPATSGSVDREFKLSKRPSNDSKSTNLVNEETTKHSTICQKEMSTFSSRNSENAEPLEMANYAKKFHSFKIAKKNNATDTMSQAASKKLLTSSGARSIGKSSDSDTKSTSPPQDLLLVSQQPDSKIMSAFTTLPNCADMDTDQKMEIAEELQTARHEKVLEVELGQSYGELTSMEIDPPQEVITLSLSEVISQPDILIVLDTNIFISHLNFIANLKDHGVSGVGFPILVIPWVVLQELDFLKNEKMSGSVNRKAIPAVRFVYSCLKSGHPHVWGQSMQKAAEKFCGLREENNDDRVLQCCLQYQQLHPCAHVVLCSDDKNLCSKALVSSVKAARKDDLLTELSDLNPIRDVTSTQDLNIFNQPQSVIDVKDQNGTRNQHFSVQKATLDVTGIISQLEKLLGFALSTILETEMKKVYDNLWTEILIVKPPWSLEDLLQCMKKHWIAVFGLIVKRNLLASVECLSDYLQVDKRPEYNSFTLTWLLTESQKLLCAFNSRSGYGGVLPHTLAALDELLREVSEDYMKTKGKSLKKSKESLENVDISVQSSLHPDPGRNITLLPFNCNSGFLMSDMGNSQMENKRQQIWATFENVWNIIYKYSSLIFATFNLPHNSLAVVMDSKLPLPEEAFQSLQKLGPAVKELLAGIQRILSSDSNVQDFEKLMEILHVFLTNETNSSASGMSAQDLHECFTHEEYRKKLTVGHSQLAELTYGLEQCNAAVCLEARNRGLV